MGRCRSTGQASFSTRRRAGGEGVGAHIGAAAIRVEEDHKRADADELELHTHLPQGPRRAMGEGGGIHAGGHRERGAGEVRACACRPERRGQARSGEVR